MGNRTMSSKNKNQTPSFHDLWVVSHAAGNLTSQAYTISARHLQDGVTRSMFNREVAYYARSIVNDVEHGKKTVAEGLIEIKKEQRSLLDQSIAIGRNGIGVVAGALQIATGAGICYASVGTLCLIAGVPLMAHGANNLYESGRNLATGGSDTVVRFVQYIKRPHPPWVTESGKQTWPTALLILGYLYTAL